MKNKIDDILKLIVDKEKELQNLLDNLYEFRRDVIAYGNGYMSDDLPCADAYSKWCNEEFKPYHSIDVESLYPEYNPRFTEHSIICKELNELYKAKNKDYGSSFKAVRNEYPNSIIIRLSDKLNRLKTLYNNIDVNVKDESIEDTLRDMANYCIMELIERRLEKWNIIQN